MLGKEAMRLMLLEEDKLLTKEFKKICHSTINNVQLTNFNNVNDFISFIYSNDFWSDGIFINTSVQMINCIHLRQYRTKIVVQIRSQIFRQIA